MRLARLFLLVLGLHLIGQVLPIVAGEIQLKNGFIIEGQPSVVQTLSPKIKIDAGGNNEVYPITLVENGMLRYFVTTTNVVTVDKSADLAKFEIFKLRQGLGSRTKSPEHVGIPAKPPSEFDGTGRRTVEFASQRGKEVVTQVITEIGPKFCKVASVGWLWDFTVATTSIRPERLDEMIRSVTDQKKPEDRFAIARFYLQAGRYLEALKELEAVANDFPDIKAKVDGFALEARQQLAKQLLDELDHRRQRGQHRLAYEAAKRFPTDQMSAANLRRLREFIAAYDDERERTEKVLALLGELQGRIENRDDKEQLGALRAEVAENLSVETLSRLKPFLDRCDDEKTKPDEKLALAYSGWLAGESHAVDNLAKALAYAKARFLIMSSLREVDATKRNILVADLMKLEGVGPEAVLALIPNLAPVLETPEAKPGQPALIEASLEHSGVGDLNQPVRYHVLLPREYSPLHSYPLIVTLRPIERTPEASLRWWGGNMEDPLQAQRHGYIVIVPNYLDEKAREYVPNSMSHYAVLQSIRDARKRFHVDSDRIYLSGHGTGADAAFDIGMSHPDEFAGVIPITGMIPDLTRFLRENAKLTSFYIITGELDRDSFERNAKTLNMLMLSPRNDIVLTEYLGRGYESYYGEIHKLFAWMELHERPKLPQKIDMFSMRPNDNRFYWLRAHTLPTPVNDSPRVTPKKTPVIPKPSGIQEKAVRYEASLLTGAERANVISIGSSPAKQHSIWLTPDMIDFTKRLEVRVKSDRKYNDFIAPSIETMLEDFRTRGDRQRVFQVKIEVQ